MAANTCGAIVGSVVTGFVLLGRVPSYWIFVCVAALAAITALVVHRHARRREADGGHPRTSRRLLAAAASMAALLFLLPRWDLARLTAGSHYYWEPWSADAPRAGIVYAAEDAQRGFITVERSDDGRLTMKTNGKYEGSDGPGEFQDLLVLIGALYVNGFDRAALVGLGPGRALRLLHELPFGRIDVAELSPRVVDAARQRFPHLVSRALADGQRVRVVIDDGRNWLQVAEPGYDYVVVAVSGAAFSGVSALYTRQFFETVASRLEPDGVLMHWLQLHHVPEHDVRSVLLTVRAVFPNVHVYATRSEEQALLVASRSPLVVDADRDVELGRGRRLRGGVVQAGLESLLELTALNVFSSDEELDRYLGAAPASRPPRILSDWRPDFEYSTPRGLAQDIPAHHLRRFSRNAVPALSHPVSADEMSGLAGLRLAFAGDPESARRAFDRADELAGGDRWRRRGAQMTGARD
jgi:spermidine synthase